MRAVIAVFGLPAGHGELTSGAVGLFPMTSSVLLVIFC